MTDTVAKKLAMRTYACQSRKQAEVVATFLMRRYPNATVLLTDNRTDWSVSIDESAQWRLENL